MQDFIGGFNINSRILGAGVGKEEVGEITLKPGAVLRGSRGPPPMKNVPPHCPSPFWPCSLPRLSLK